MPNVRQARSGWHIGDSNYCGPFTDLSKEREVRNEIDECCRRHDIEYGSNIETKKADQNLIDCLPDYHPIRGIFKVKQTIDSLTDYKSDELFRQHMPPKRNAQQAFRINQYYANKKKKAEQPVNDGAGPSHEGENEAGALLEAMADHNEPEEEPMLQDANGGGGGGGGGLGGGGDGQNIAPDKPLGIPSHKSVRTYQRSYTSYVVNGVADQAWANTPGTESTAPYVTWCDGWSIIPWGMYPMCITPNEWYAMGVNCKRFRVLGCKVSVDSVIPFQEALVGGGTTRQAITSFSNRPSILVYKDNGDFLPQLWDTPLTDLLHNWYGTLARGTFSQSVLQRPTFRFSNWDVTRQKHKVRAIPPANQPNAVLSLEANGKVKTLYPGGNFTESWTNPNKAWHSFNLPWDRANRIKTADGIDVGDYMENKNRALSTSYYGGVGCRGFINNGTETVGVNDYVCQYQDTGLEIKHSGPPYILMKMEPYYGTDDTPMSIFAQIHIHYEMTIEHEERDGVGQYCSMLDIENGGGTVGTSNYTEFGNQILNMQAAAPADNKLNRMAGTTAGHFSYT